MFTALAAGRIPLPAPLLLRATTPGPLVRRLCLVPHPDGWALLVDDHDEPAWVVPRLQRGLRWAKAAGEELQCRVELMSRAGALRWSHDFAEETA